MNLFTRLAVAIKAKAAGMLSPVDTGGSWGAWRSWGGLIKEAFAGAWQRNIEWTRDTVLAFHAVYACETLISNDVGKLRLRLVRLDPVTGVWSETFSSAFSPVLKKPNRYQNHIQFKQWWITSKLVRGNAYILKQRDGRGVVVAMYVLDPDRVMVLVSPDGGVYYQLNADNLMPFGESGVTVPASEIIHDRMNCLFHPLVGTSPLFASGLAAHHGLKIQTDSTNFYANGATPGGLLTAPGAITDETAARLKEIWETKYSGANAGKVAVLGDGLKYEAMRMTAVDAETIKQLEYDGVMVCSTFHVPPFKVGLGALPAGQKVADMNQIYYSDCLQSLIEEMELCLDEGLGLSEPKEGVQYGTELDLEGLLRMDAASQVTTLAAAVAGAIMTPNEARGRMNMGPLKGGGTVYLQQQNYSLEALAKRDESADPFGTTPAPAPALPAPTVATDPPEPTPDDQAKEFVAYLLEGLTRELA